MRNFFGFRLESVGFWASMICAVHCALLPVLIMFFSWRALKIVESDFVETIVIVVTFSLAVLSLSTGFAKHNRLKAIYFLVAGILLVALSRITHTNLVEICLASMGATLLASAHYVNWKLGALQHQPHKKPKK